MAESHETHPPHNYFCFSCLTFGQDSLRLDTTPKLNISAGQDSLIADSPSSTSKKVAVKPKKQKKKLQKSTFKEEPHASREENTKNVDTSEKDYGLLLLAFLLTGVIVLGLSRLTFAKTSNSNTASNDEEFISDYLSRIFLSRRDYYRNVYLKSDAWQRKRYVVLKRDNWRCVYCGGKATQVHHKKYAKRNIGNEPIEWLVSICKSCHDTKH